MAGHEANVTRVALGILTDFVNRPDGIKEGEFGETEMARVIIDGEVGDVDLVYGFLQLSMILLVKLEKAGYPMAVVLGDIGLRYRDR